MAKLPTREKKLIVTKGLSASVGLNRPVVWATNVVGRSPLRIGLRALMEKSALLALSRLLPVRLVSMEELELVQM